MGLKIFWKLLRKIQNKFLFLFYYIKHFPRFNCAVFKCEGSFVFGKDSYIGKGSILVIGKNATLMVGKNSYFGEYSNIRVDKEIIIGDNCKIAQFVTLVDGDYDFSIKPLSFDYRKNSSVYIGNNVFIGTNSVILRGSYIIDNSIIGANSVVNRKTNQ